MIAERFERISLPQYVGRGYKRFWTWKGRYRVCKGSRASKKSKTTALWYIVNMMKYPQANLLVVRKSYRTLKDSCFAELKWAIHRLKVDAFWEFRLNPLEMTYKPTGQKVYFRGLDDPLKITSITVDIGCLCWLWIEEAYEITKEHDFDTINESIRGEVPQGLFKQVTLTFNPWNERHWLKKKFFDNPDEETLAMTTNYMCNEWLDKSDLAVFEAMKKNNPRRYRVAGLGEWGIVDGLIYEAAPYVTIQTQGVYYTRQWIAAAGYFKYTAHALPSEYSSSDTYFKRIGETVKKVVIPVIPRAKPCDCVDMEDPTDEDIIAELFDYCSKLNEKVNENTEIASREKVKLVTQAEYDALVAAGRVESGVLYCIEDTDLYDEIKEGIESGAISVVRADRADYASEDTSKGTIEERLTKLGFKSGSVSLGNDTASVNIVTRQGNYVIGKVTGLDYFFSANIPAGETKNACIGTLTTVEGGVFLPAEDSPCGIEVCDNATANALGFCTITAKVGKNGLIYVYCKNDGTSGRIIGFTVTGIYFGYEAAPL